MPLASIQQVAFNFLKYQKNHFNSYPEGLKPLRICPLI